MWGIESSKVLLLLAILFLSWVVRKAIAFQLDVRSLEYVYSLLNDLDLFYG